MLKRARILGELEKDNELAQAIELLRNEGYQVKYTPVSGIAEFEVNCFQEFSASTHTNLTDLKKFLFEKKLTRSMWNIV